MAVENLDAFLAAVDEYGRALPREEVTKLHRAIAFKGLEGVVFATPVDSGRARGNWQVTQGSPAEGEVDRTDKEGKGVMTQEGAKLLGVRPFSITWITNNVPYAEVLENGEFDPANPGPSKDRREDRKGETLVQDGYSVQAPNGMVKVTFEYLQSLFP